jgi:hypothetical protein
MPVKKADQASGKMSKTEAKAFRRQLKGKAPAEKKGITKKAGKKEEDVQDEE